MEIFMQAITSNVQLSQLKRAIADELHGDEFKAYQPLPINFDISVFPLKAGQCRRGVLTVPSLDIGQHFLRDYGGTTPRYRIVVGDKAIQFKESRNKEPRPQVLDKLRLTPYVDPELQEKQENLWAELQALIVSVLSVQFGWECRDNVYSVEYEKLSGGTGKFCFDTERREFRVRLPEGEENVYIVIRASQIAWAALERVSPEQSVLFLSLSHAPAYESDLSPSGPVDEDTTAGRTWTTGRAQRRQRRVALNFDHHRYAMYTSLALRIVCEGENSFDDLKTLCSFAHVKRHKFIYPIDRGRRLFSPEVQKEYLEWLAGLDWEVAFQVDVLARSNIMDLREILRLRSQLARLREKRSVTYVAFFVRHLAREARDPSWYRAPSDPSKALEELFKRCRNDFVTPEETAPDDLASGVLQLFNCYHAIITPTTIHLEGPHLERCNRVIRKYADHASSFLRVRFADEAHLQFRHDRDVDHRAFVEERFGRILKRGFVIAGRHFHFLGYSSSGLKEHSFWFVTEFTQKTVALDGNITEETVTAESIIDGLGTFDNNPHDPDLMQCPARWGARISQSFSATQAFATVQVEKISLIPDITRYKATPMSDVDDAELSGKDSQYVFTDGVGTISPQLAEDIWKAFRERSHRRLGDEVPAAYQIRIQGAKGMLSRDPNLTGREICLRPSMVKYDAPGSAVLEIAEAFYKPRKFALNRPLVMLLEELNMTGGYEYLKYLQDQIIRKTELASESLTNAAQLFESSRLGAAFGLAATFQELSALGVENLADNFTQQVVNFARHHVLRDLRYHARIPVPGGHTLVGVADIHEYLEEGEIFACVVPEGGKDPIYLQGPTMVARSPVIHRGDVQVAIAIGPPPPGSPFEIEPLTNTVVFSTKGSRPLPSCLGGGDLDGDEYVLTDLPLLLPQTTYEPASYDAPERNRIGHKSTLSDVAEWVTEYLYSDTVGTIAINWLTLMDQSPQGVLDPNCGHGNTVALERLAQLHSDAVDYPKSGTAVALRDMPRSRLNAKPDWAKPEIQHSDSPVEYYESQRWIGRLCREPNLHITLPEVKRPPIPASTKMGFPSLEYITSVFRKGSFPLNDPVEKALCPRVALHVVSVRRYSGKRIESQWRAYKAYVSALRSICVTYSLIQRHGMMLTEEEVVVGTIVGKTTQPRIRQDKMAQMRDQVSSRVARTSMEIAGSKSENKKEVVKRAWVAFRISTIDPEAFGSRSFGLIALRELFDALKSLDECPDEGTGSNTPDDG